MSPDATTSFERRDLRPGAILMNPDNVKCSLDRVDRDTFHLRVLEGNKIDGQDHITRSYDDLISQKWQMKKRAAA